MLRRLLAGVDPRARDRADPWRRRRPGTATSPARASTSSTSSRPRATSTSSSSDGGARGNTKQFFPDELDPRLTRLALERIGDAAVVHPLLMFSRMRFVLEGLQPPAAATAVADYGRLTGRGARASGGLPGRVRCRQALLQRLVPRRRGVPDLAARVARRARRAHGGGRADERPSARRAPGVGPGPARASTTHRLG